MANKIKYHPIRDNQIVIENKEYFGLGTNKIIVGVQNDSGVEAQEVYNLSTQKHHPWLVLALETGKRGWFPGCIIKGNVASGEMRAAPALDAEVLEVLSNAQVEVLDITSIHDAPEISGWHRIKVNNISGYIRLESLANIRYTNPD